MDASSTAHLTFVMHAYTLTSHYIRTPHSFYDDFAMLKWRIALDD